MGQSQSIQVQTPTEVKTPQPPATEAAKCPVNTSTKKEEVSACPVKGDNPPQPAPVSSEKTECPVVYKNPNVYNVGLFKFLMVMYLTPSRSTIRR